MTDIGYIWSIQPDGDGWAWSLADRDAGTRRVEGRAPSRAIAAAMVVRAIARGLTASVSDAQSLAA